MRSTIRNCVIAGAIYVILAGVILMVLRNVIPDEEISFRLCPFCDQPMP